MKPTGRQFYIERFYDENTGRTSWVLYQKRRFWADKWVRGYRNKTDASRMCQYLNKRDK